MKSSHDSNGRRVAVGKRAQRGAMRPATVKENMMMAIVCPAYGSSEFLKFQEVDKPDVKDDDVLVRVHAASINTADWVRMTGRPYIARLMGSGLRRPRFYIAGQDVAGRVVAVGKNIEQFRPGDEVFGESKGALAEYVCAKESELVLKPANVTFEQAAAAPIAGITALQGLRDMGPVLPGQSVLINGASGGVGTFSVQIAKAFGAEVTGVCSTSNVDMVRSISADRVFDYTQADFTQSGQLHDVIFDSVGNHSISACRRALKSTGTYVSVAGQVKEHRWLGPMMRVLRMLVVSLFVSQKMVVVSATTTKTDLAVLRELLESGKITPIIDRRYALSAVPEAMRYLQTGHARAKIVINV